MYPGDERAPLICQLVKKGSSGNSALVLFEVACRFIPSDLTSDRLYLLFQRGRSHGAGPALFFKGSLSIYPTTGHRVLGMVSLRAFMSLSAQPAKATTPSIQEWRPSVLVEA